MGDVCDEIEQRWNEGRRHDAFRGRGRADVENGARAIALLPGDVENHTIEAKDLRRLISNVCNHPGQLYIRGVHIIGRLNLEGIPCPNSGALPPLKFIQCFFEGGICFESSRISSLSLRGSRFYINRKKQKGDYDNGILHINGAGAEITGRLDLSHIQPWDDDKLAKIEGSTKEKSRKRKRLLKKFYQAKKNQPKAPGEEALSKISDNTLLGDFSRITVGGNVYGGFSVFAEEWQWVKFGYNQKLPYALSFDSATLGSLSLTPKFKCNGGLKLGRLHCLGEAWLIGAKLTASYRNPDDKTLQQLLKRGVLRNTNGPCAIEAQNAIFEKNISISDHTKEGDVFSSSTFIIGSLKFLSVRAHSIWALSLTVESISADYREHFPPTSLVFSNLEADQLHISSKAPSEKSSFNKDRRLDCKIYINHAKLNSLDIDCALATGRDVYASAITVIGSATIKVDASILYLSEFSKIGGNLKISGSVWNVILPEINIAGSLHLEGWLPNRDYLAPYVENMSSFQRWVRKNNHIPKLDLQGAKIGHSLRPSEQTSCEGEVKGISWGLECYPNFELVATGANPGVGKYQFSAMLRSRNPNNDQRKTSLFKRVIGQLARLLGHTERIARPTVIPLTGTSEPFHKLNRSGILNYESPTAAKQYLVLFCAFVWGTQGPFRILTEHEIHKIKPKLDEEKSTQEFTTAINQLHKTILYFTSTNEFFGESLVSNSLKDEAKEQLQNTDIKRILVATVCYGPAIFNAVFILHSDTKKPVTMVADEVILSLDGKSEDDPPIPEAAYRPYIFAPLAAGNAKIIPNSRDVESITNYLCLSETVENDKTSSSKPQSLSGDAAEKAWWQINSLQRPALIDLSSASCGLLEDWSGRGWGDGAFLKTDRFTFGSVSRDSGEKGPQKISLSNIINERKKFREKLLTDPHNYDGLSYANHPQMSFHEQRLLWLMRYDRTLRPDKDRDGDKEIPPDVFQRAANFILNIARLPPAFQNRVIPPQERRGEIDGGAFRQVARIYRQLGLTEKAKYIDEARYRIEMEQFRENIRTTDLDMTWKWGAMTVGISLAFLYISSTVGLSFINQQGALFALLTEALIFLSVCVLLLGAVWAVWHEMIWRLLQKYFPIKAILTNPMRWVLFFILVSVSSLLVFDGVGMFLDQPQKLFPLLTSTIKIGYGLWVLISLVMMFAFVAWNFVTWKILQRIGVFLIYFYNRVSRHIFKYGLSLRRPIAAGFMFLVIGWWGTQYMNDHKLLAIEAMAISTTIDARWDIAIAKGAEDEVVPISRVPCGKNIDYGLYALDTFIPLIELDQEERCLIRPFDAHLGDRSYFRALILDPDREPQSGNAVMRFLKNSVAYRYEVIIEHPTTWRLLQGLYVLCGWILISVTIVILTNIFRQRSYDGE